jgi:hypothetical protein
MDKTDYEAYTSKFLESSGTRSANRDHQFLLGSFDIIIRPCTYTYGPRRPRTSARWRCSSDTRAKGLSDGIRDRDADGEE